MMLIPKHLRPRRAKKDKKHFHNTDGRSVWFWLLISAALSHHIFPPVPALPSSCTARGSQMGASPGVFLFWNPSGLGLRPGFELGQGWEHGLHGRIGPRSVSLGLHALTPLP
ncbi:hypothetical protein VTK73DRAFT_10363 [Phialemonium thermophilum]|uniref:Uncharacterized protein n=1 Tax=Phialemonium thermophilum TaxID=223376 RepID=A0ABR3XG87_9PEZI